MRVTARGRVAIHGDGYGRGKILDLSRTGLLFRIAGPSADYRDGDRVGLELRFDGADGGWWQMVGRIVRVVGSQIAIAFEQVPTDFADWLHAEGVAAVEAKRIDQVLVVDPFRARRAEVSRALRATGHSVHEVATPLEAIAQLGESRYHPQIVAIADTVPASIANDLRAHVRSEHGELELLRIGRVAS